MGAMFKYLKILPRALHPLLSRYRRDVKPYSEDRQGKSVEERFKPFHEMAALCLSYFNIDWKIEGIEHFLDAVKRKNVMIVSNHISDVDPIILISMTEEPFTYVAKDEIRKKFPKIIRDCTEVSDPYYLDRSDLKQSVKVMSQITTDLMNKKMSVLIYPEGTRNKAPLSTDVAPFHPGSFRPALKAKCPILCSACFGNFRIFPASPDYKRIPVEFEFYKIIEPEEYEGMDTIELSKMCHDIVQQGVNKLKQEDKEFFKNGWHKIPLKKGKLR